MGVGTRLHPREAGRWARAQREVGRLRSSRCSRNRPDAGAVNRAGTSESLDSIADGFVRRQTAAAHFDDHADQPADHLPDEVRSLDAKQDQRAVLVNLERVSG